ncbi:acetate/propionate family kinase [Phenylobacterium sp. J426]|uniref:acetate/propionate family kinase n=1 Tax=Phenylobacterium sp. J426 TaxID=2898439 RepID=UPI00215137D3|nr:acetate/propionate family kinase [Phenylobacterium sp. J426]MCR5876418.1 acetate/propionate family kinase [Phenylobacterium sp. J426]
MSGPRLLTLNAGSSSLKFAVYGLQPEPPLLMSGQVSGLGVAPRFRARAEGASLADEAWPTVGLDAVLERLFGWMDNTGWSLDIAAVGHRIVHGGLEFTRPTVLTPDAVGRLDRLSLLAPLHQPFNLQAVSRAQARFPSSLQVGVFDTAFHAAQPRVARLYALPRDLIDEGVIAYGFHGLSYEYIAGVLKQREGPQAGGRTIVLHLGSGVSLCALDGGRSVATTMGFSALDGPPMSTRSGSLDPGVLLYLMQAKGLGGQEIADLLYHRSGLLGLSGVSGDMVTLLASEDPRAREALDVYVHRLARQVGALAASLGGLDTLVFTAGVGENAPSIRERVCRRCAWLGVALDPDANTSGRGRISAAESAVKVLVVPTDEELVIARAVVNAARRSAR